MKIKILCCLLFLCLSPISLAQESPKPENDQAAVENSGGGEFIFKATPDRASPEFSEKYCAYMRTYRVRREYADSDVVSPAGYTTCVPSKRFELKNAVVSQTESAGDKQGSPAH